MAISLGLLIGLCVLGFLLVAFTLFAVITFCIRRRRRHAQECLEAHVHTMQVEDISKTVCLAKERSTHVDSDSSRQRPARLLCADYIDPSALEERSHQIRGQNSNLAPENISGASDYVMRYGRCPTGSTRMPSVAYYNCGALLPDLGDDYLPMSAPLPRTAYMSTDAVKRKRSHYDISETENGSIASSTSLDSITSDYCDIDFSGMEYTNYRQRAAFLPHPVYSNVRERKQSRQIRGLDDNSFADDASKASRIFSMYFLDLYEFSLWNEGLFSGKEELFRQKMVDQDGGVVSVSGVRLEIPDQALTEPTLITVGIVPPAMTCLDLTVKQAILSPTVLCLPSGLTFNKEVTLSFPHCAVGVEEDWSPKILMREGSFDTDGTWQPMSGEGVNKSEVVTDRVTLKLTHFTLYTCVGESKPDRTAAKVVRLVSFAPKIGHTSLFKPVVYCINYYKELEDIQAYMDKLGSPMADAPMPLFVHDDGNDVIVEVEKLSEHWAVDGCEMEVLPFEQVWHASSPHCTFVFRAKSARAEIACDFQSYQSGRENHSIKLRIAEKFTMNDIPIQTVEDNPVREVTNELVILLDPESVTANWRHLAEQTGCNPARIKWLETKESPTRVLLDTWLKEGKTFQQLVDVMTTIERLDAAEEILKRLPLLEPKSASNCVS